MSRTVLLLSLPLAMVWCLPLRAEVENVNDAFVKAELYMWNRLCDLLQIFRCGVAGGPTIGAEIAITEYGQLGAYAANEKGVTFPHFFPPLWLVPFLDGEEIFEPHSGTYRTWATGLRRWENTNQQDVRFERAPWDVRAQLGLGVVHLYADVQAGEIGDFFAGIIGNDPRDDDEEIDPNARREPARQLGRGVTNVLAGVLEIPMSMYMVGQDSGGFAGLTAGLFQGFWRFCVREGIGLLEVVSFPMGWGPIIEPEFPFQPARTTNWRINEPAFRKKL